MRVRSWAALGTAAAIAGCGLFPSLDGLTTPTDASIASDATIDVANEAAPPDASATDATDAPSEAPALTCDGGLTACGNACIDTTTSATHCGACGHDCLGSTCVASQCQPETIATAQNGAYDLAVGGGELYWTNASAGTIAKCTASSCLATVTILAQGRPSPEDLVIDATNVYWSEQGGVAYCARAGCNKSPTVLVSGKVASDGGALDYDGIAVGPSLVYFPLGGSFQACAIAGCSNAPTTLTSAGADDLTADGTNVYGTSGGNVFKCPLAGCTGSTRVNLVTGLGSAESVAADQKNVYFTYTASVGSCPLAGCVAPTVLVTGQANPNDIVTDGVNVYWTDPGADTVSRCGVSGCNGTPTVLATSQSQPKGIAVDSTYVYWGQVSGDKIMRVVK